MTGRSKAGMCSSPATPAPSAFTRCSSRGLPAGAPPRILDGTEGRGVDHISEVDFGGNLATTLAVMKVGCAIGAYASKGAPEPTLPFYPLLFSNVVVRFIQCYAMPDDIRERAHADLARWCEEGRLKHLPTRVMPLEEAAAAHELVERSGFIGKVMLRL